MSNRNYDYVEKMNKNKKRKEKSLKVFYSTVAAYGLVAPDTAEAAEVDAVNNQNKNETQAAPVATAEETAAVNEAQNVEVVEAKEYLGQVAGEMGLKHAGIAEDLELNQALNESYDMLDSGELGAEQAKDQVSKLEEAENKHQTSDSTKTSGTQENKKEVDTTESAATDSTTSTSKENNTSKQTNSSTSETSGKVVSKTSETPAMSTGNKELDKKVSDIKKMKDLEANYSKESVAALNKAMKELEDKVAKGELSEAEIAQSLKELEEATKNLTVDKATLVDLTKQLEHDLLTLGSANKETAATIKSILDEAKVLQAKEGATQAEINQLIEKMAQHADDLDISSEKLQGHIDDVMNDYKQLDYTALSYKQLNDAIRDALLVVNNEDATQAERYLAYTQIDKALDQLVQLRTASELQSKIDDVLNLDAKDYTSESYKHFSEILKKAQKVMNATEVSTDTYSNIYHELAKSIDDLVSKDSINSELQVTINEAKQLLNDNKKKQVYTNETLDIVLKQLKIAETVDFNMVSADRLVEVNNNLKKAMNDLIEIENLKGLETLINEGKKLVGLGKGNFTEVSWNNLNKQLAYAEAIITNSKSTVDEISRAYQKLNNAVDAMVDCETLLKDLDGLLFQADAYEKEKDKFTTVSWQAFENALIKDRAVNRETINPDTLNAIVNELGMSINQLFLTSNEATNALQKEFEKLVTLDKETAYTAESWARLQQVVKEAYALVDSIEAVETSAVLRVTEDLAKAINDLAYSNTDRQTAKQKLQDGIAAFDKMSDDERKAILHGYEEYAQAVEEGRELLNNLNLTTAQMNELATKIGNAKNNLTIDDGKKTIVVNTSTTIGKKTGIKDGKLNIEVSAKQPIASFFTYSPAFETTIKIPHNLLPFFENGTWRKYVKIAYNNSTGSIGFGDYVVQSGDKKSGGIFGSWDPTLNLLSSDDPKVLEDLKISYKIVNGQPVLYITTNKMVPGWGLMPVNEFKLNYFISLDLENYMKDGNALPIQEKGDDVEIQAISRVMQEGIAGATNYADKKEVANLEEMNELGVQDDVELGDIYTHVVDGTNTIVGKATQSKDKYLDGDIYQAVFDLNGKEIGRATLDKDGNFIYNYTTIDPRTGNIVAQNFKQGDRIKVSIVGVEIEINEDALNRENGRIQINLDQKIKATDDIIVTLHGTEKGYDGEKTATAAVEVEMQESFEDWEISHPVVKDPQIGDKSVSGYVKVDSSYDRTYYVQVKINGGKVITGEVDKYGNFNVALDKGLEAYDDISVVIVGQQGDAGKKQSAENLKRVPAKNTEVNKNGLEAAIDVADYYNNDNKTYTKESFDSLSKALKSAKAVFENEAATQAEVNSARDTLNGTINNLVTINSVKPSQVSLDALKSLLKEADSLSPSKYSATTYKVLVDSMEEAQKALVDEAATQESIEKMITLMSSAMNQLKAPSVTDPSAVDQKRLEELIADAKNFKGSDYTQYSFAVLQEAIRKGDEALGNPNAATLNNAYNEIKRAMTNLVPVVSVGEEGRQQLLEEITDAKGLKETDYTKATYNKLQEAIALSEKTYDNKSSSVEELSAARNQLLQAKMALSGKNDVRKQLSITYVEAKNAIEKQKMSYYTTKSFSIMNEAYKHALELDKNQKATANELDQALQDLKKAIDSLVISTNIETLQKLIDDASVIISKPNEKWKYTTQTWNELNVQLHNAKDILAASESSMEDISFVMNHLNKALNNLVSKDDLLAKLDVALESGKTVNPDDYSFYDGKDTALNMSYQEFKKVFEKALKIDREKIEADDLSKLIGSLNESISSLVTTKEEATKKLNETLEKVKTTGITSDSSHPNDLYKNGFMIRQSIKNAEAALIDPKATADDIYNAEKTLQEALDKAEYQDAKATEIRQKIDKHINEFGKINPKDYVIGYDDYEKVINDSKAELERNYGLTLDELTDMLHAIETTKESMIKARELNFITSGSTKSEFKDVSVKDGKLNIKVKSKNPLLGIAAYTPSFDTRIELPKSMRVVFELIMFILQLMVLLVY